MLFVKNALEKGTLRGTDWPQLDLRKKLIVVTAHRRENFGAGIESICTALAQLAHRENLQLVYPVHSNPNVLGTVTARLGGLNNVSSSATAGLRLFCRPHAARVFRDF